MVVVLGDRGVDLHRHAGRAQKLEPGHRGIKRPVNLAEAIVGRGIRSVKTDRHPPEADVHNPLGHAFVHDRAIGCQGGGEPHRTGVLGKVEQVWTHQRLAAGEDHDGPARLWERADHRLGLGGGQVILAQRARHIEPAAVNTCQIARGGAFPEQQSQRWCGWLFDHGQDYNVQRARRFTAPPHFFDANSCLLDRAPGRAAELGRCPGSPMLAFDLEEMRRYSWLSLWTHQDRTNPVTGWRSVACCIRLRPFYVLWETLALPHRRKTSRLPGGWSGGRERRDKAGDGNGVGRRVEPGRVGELALGTRGRLFQ